MESNCVNKLCSNKILVENKKIKKLCEECELHKQREIVFVAMMNPNFDNYKKLKRDKFGLKIIEHWCQNRDCYGIAHITSLVGLEKCQRGLLKCTKCWFI